jgi:hypothetical protein
VAPAVHYYNPKKLTCMPFRLNTRSSHIFSTYHPLHLNNIVQIHRQYICTCTPRLSNNLTTILWYSPISCRALSFATFSVSIRSSKRLKSVLPEGKNESICCLRVRQAPCTRSSCKVSCRVSRGVKPAYKNVFDCSQQPAFLHLFPLVKIFNKRQGVTLTAARPA